MAASPSLPAATSLGLKAMPGIDIPVHMHTGFIRANHPDVPLLSAQRHRAMAHIVDGINPPDS
jgi:hypothetical protein